MPRGGSVHHFDRKHDELPTDVASADSDATVPVPTWRPVDEDKVATLLALAGIGVLVAGAYLLVDGAIQIARGVGISETIIGLTVVAVGTSLPEFATSAVAPGKFTMILSFCNRILFIHIHRLGTTYLCSPRAASWQGRAHSWTL